MIDLRRYANKDLISELSIIGLNNYEEGLSKFLSLIRYSKKVGGDQFNGISVLGNYANEVGRDQLNVISVIGNYANKVGRDQWNGFFGVGNYAGKVGGDQGNVISVLGNYANKVGRDQYNGFSVLGNYAKKVGGDQFNKVFGFMNYAKKVGGDQWNGIFGFINYANEVKGDQKGALICVQTKNQTAIQKECLIRYNSLEKIGFGASVWSKVKKAENYLKKLSEKDNENYVEVLKSFVRKTPTLRKRITGHWTYSDVLSRQAKKELKKQGEKIK